MERKSGDSARVRALEYAVVVNQLLDAKIFPDVVKAVETRDLELFNQLCERAGVSPPIRKCLRELVFENPLVAVRW